MPKDGDEDESGHNYYFDSIADMVRLQRQIANIKPGEASGLPSWTDGTCSRHELISMKFDMWVALPENVTRALHTYSQLNYNHALREVTALEDLHDWRNHYPGLESIVMDETGDCDIVLLRTSFSLMNTFPPHSSKLGLVVELDFRHVNGENFKALSQFSAWKCVNSMFQAGYLFRKTEHKSCKVPEIGVVKPFFEADWWAGQFTRLTDKRKSAEEQGDENAVLAADDFSRNFLQTLTMMQEIFAMTPNREDGYEPPPKRMAVLLWTFSQAQPGHRGITTWQKLITPPNRNTVTTPEPADNVHVFDRAVDSSTTDDFDTHMETVSFSQNTQIPSPSTYAPTTFQTGLTPLQHFNSDTAQHIDFSTFGSTGFTPSAANHYDLSNENFPTPSMLVEESSMMASQDAIDEHVVLAFDANGQGRDEHAPFQAEEHTTYNEHYDDDHAAYSRDASRHRPLAKFDMSTHMLLQAQLQDHSMNEKPDTDVATDFIVDNLDTMVEAEDALSNFNTPAITDSQVSFAGHMDYLGLQDEAMSEALISATMIMDPIASQNEITAMIPVQTAVTGGAQEQHPVVFHSPRIQRPRLLAHHSFAGVLTGHAMHSDGKRLVSANNIQDGRDSSGNNLGMANANDNLVFDTPVRNDFARLIEHMQQQQQNDQNGRFTYDEIRNQTYLPLEENLSLIAEQIYYAHDPGRPRSQPLPTQSHSHSNASSDLQLNLQAVAEFDLMEDRQQKQQEHEHEHEQPEFTIVEGYTEAEAEVAVGGRDISEPRLELETEQEEERVKTLESRQEVGSRSHSHSHSLSYGGGNEDDHDESRAKDNNQDESHRDDEYMYE